MSKNKRAVLLDVSAMMYRAYFANMNFRTKTEPTGAVYGFINTLLSIIKEFSPDYLVAGFDVKRSSLKRSEIFKDYKAQRQSVPEDLLIQFPRVEELLDCFNITKFKIDGYEADDVLGTVAKFLSEHNVETFVITGDKDLAQIIDKNINIALLGKGEGGEKFKIISNDEDVIEYLGVLPNKIPDLFGLIGDSSDGIPGVRKIGPKKAIPMLEKYGSLENIYENIDKLTEISGIGKSLINNMIEDKELAFLSKKLAIICQDVPIQMDIDEFSYGINNEKLLDLFTQLEFKSLINKLGINNVKEESVIDFEKRELISINSIENLKKFENNINSEKNISIFYCDNYITINTLNCDFYFKISPIISNFSLFGVNNNEQVTLTDIIEVLKNYTGVVLGYNIKNLLKLEFSFNKYYDLMIGYHLLTSKTNENIDLILGDYTSLPLEKYSDIFGKTKIDEVDEKEYSKFLAKKSFSLLLSFETILKELEDKNLLSNFLETEMPLVEILATMENNGIKINPEYFSNYSEELENSIEILQNKIFEIAGEKFNLNSPKQLAEILFFKLNLPPVKKTKTGLSTDEEVLEKLKSDGNDIAKHILEYRKLSKLKNTYVDAIPKLKDENNRIHTTFNQIGTTTGRLSSSEPNLQNIPVKTDEGMKIRQGFIAKAGNILMGIDYSQIELRVLAQMSEDENLRLAYNNNMDLHSLTAQKIFELDDSSMVTREQRIIAKTINFSIIYGKTAFGLAKELGITQKEASEYIEKYFSQYPKVKDFEHKIIKSTEEKGYTETYFGRRRIIDGINSKNRNIKNQADRMAVNSVIQGTAAEIIKKVMIEINKYILKNSDVKLLLQVHDELIFEIDENTIEIHRENIEKIMKNSVIFDSVPLEINTNIGYNWAETK